MARSIPRRAITKIKDRKKLELTASVYSKRANQRLRELERTLKDPMSSNAYRQIRDFAEDNRSFMSITSNGEFKFKTAFKKMSLEDLKEEIKQLDTFLFEAKTSTVKGAKAHYKKIKDSIANSPSEGKTQRVKDYFKNMDEDEFNEFWRYAGIQSLWAMYGSDETVKIIEAAVEKDLSMKQINNMVTDAINKGKETIQDLEEYMQLDLGDMIDYM